jgi:hypothetical protein
MRRAACRGKSELVLGSVTALAGRNGAPRSHPAGAPPQAARVSGSSLFAPVAGSVPDTISKASVLAVARRTDARPHRGHPHSLAKFTPRETSGPFLRDDMSGCFAHRALVSPVFPTPSPNQIPYPKRRFSPSSPRPTPLPNRTPFPIPRLTPRAARHTTRRTPYAAAVRPLKRRVDVKSSRTSVASVETGVRAGLATQSTGYNPHPLRLSGQIHCTKNRQPSSAQPLTCSPAHPLTRSPTHPLTHSPAHPLTRSPARIVRRTVTQPSHACLEGSNAGSATPPVLSSCPLNRP